MNDQGGDILARIRSSYNQFTRAEKKVADYVVSSPKSVMFMSITELADACGVGDTSVFRFCRTVGTGGYQEFKMQMALAFQSSGADESPLSGNVQPSDNVSVLVQKVLQNSQRALSETAALLDPQALEKAVDLLLSARRIAFFGVGASLNSAQKAAHKFMRIEPKVVCQSDAHMQAMMAATMTPQDVAVVFSYSGATKDTNAVVRLVKSRKAKVISISRFQKSPLSEFTDVTLLCGVNESPVQGGSAGADICQSFLTDLLFTEYYHRNYEVCNQVNAQTAAAVLDKLY